MQTSNTAEMVTISRAEYERLQQKNVQLKSTRVRLEAERIKLEAEHARLEAKLAAREQEQRVGKWIQFKLLLDEARQAVYAFTQICVATGDVDFICTSEVVQHRRRSSTSSLSCSASQPG